MFVIMPFQSPCLGTVHKHLSGESDAKKIQSKNFGGLPYKKFKAKIFGGPLSDLKNFRTPLFDIKLWVNPIENHVNSTFPCEFAAIFFQDPP